MEISFFTLFFISLFWTWNRVRFTFCCMEQNAPLFQEHSCKFQLNPLSKCWVREQTHFVKFTLWNENELFIVKYSMKINFDKIFGFSVKIYPYLQILVKNKLKLGEKIKWPNHFKVLSDEELKKSPCFKVLYRILTLFFHVLLHYFFMSCFSSRWRRKHFSFLGKYLE